VARALSGSSDEVAQLIGLLTPVIRARVAQRLDRSGALARCGDARFEVEDLTQEVLMRLFQRGGQALRRWDPARGLSLPNFAGLVARRHVASVLRRQHLHKESATPQEELCNHPEPLDRTLERLEAAQTIEMLFDVLRARISARAMQIALLIHAEGRSVSEVAEQLEMSRNAVYVACTRIRKQIIATAVELDLSEAERLRPARRGADVGKRGARRAA